MRASSLRKGNVIIHNGAPYRVIETNHSTPGNLRARVQTKLRNLLNKTQTEVRYGATEDVEEANVFSLKASFLYSDHSGYHFMNSDNYEQMAIVADDLGDNIYYLQEGMEVHVTLYEGAIIGIELPPTVTLTVAETEPEVRGGTASNSPKPAKTETGLQISVPPFIKQGERVVVNTSDGSYVGRSSE